MSKIVHEIFVNLLTSLIFSLITYYSTSLNTKFSHNFYVYIGCQWLLSLCASFYGMFIGSLVQTEQNLPSVMIVSKYLKIRFLLFL